MAEWQTSQKKLLVTICFPTRVTNVVLAAHLQLKMSWVAEYPNVK